MLSERKVSAMASSKRLAWWLLPAATATILAVSGPVQSAGSNDPTLEPVPVLDLDDPAKSVVVRLRFDSRTQTSAVSTEIVADRARGRAGEPPLLGVQTLDRNGAVVDSFNAWHPMWVMSYDSAGHETKIHVPGATGRFIAPFDRDLTTMKVRDIPQATEVASVDLTPAIAAYCQDNQDDPDCKVADLDVSGLGPLNPPPLVLLGTPAVVNVRTTITNHGPDTVDARLTRTASASAGATVTPTETVSDEPALAQDEVRQRDLAYTVTCDQPGAQSVTFRSELATTHAADVDPDLANNARETTMAIDCAVPVTVNIKPGGDPNSVNTGANGNNIPLAVLSTQAGEYGNPLAFDARTINPLSARLGVPAVVLAGGGATESHGRGHPERSYELDERTKDGDTDMVLHFGPAGTGLQLGHTEVCLKGTFTSSGGQTLTFYGCGPVRIVK